MSDIIHVVVVVITIVLLLLLLLFPCKLVQICADVNNVLPALEICYYKYYGKLLSCVCRGKVQCGSVL